MEPGSSTLEVSRLTPDEEFAHISADYRQIVIDAATPGGGGRPFRELTLEEFALYLRGVGAQPGSPGAEWLRNDMAAKCALEESRAMDRLTAATRENSERLENVGKQYLKATTAIHWLTWVVGGLTFLAMIAEAIQAYCAWVTMIH